MDEQITTGVLPDERFNALRHHVESGATRSYAARRDALKALATALKKHEQNVLEAMHRDMRKPAFEVQLSELGVVRSEIAYTLEHLREWMRVEEVGTPLTIQPASSSIHRQPLGVVLIIGPWNYPLQLVLAPLIGAIAAGNCAVVKPSNEAPHTAKVTERIIREAFAEEHVAVVQGPGNSVGPQLIERFRFDHIFFTGSPAVGAKIAAMAAPTLTPITLELGGKSPAIVDRNVNIAVAAKRIAWAKFFNAGQTCISPDHALVHAEVMEPFLKAFTHATQGFFGSDPKASPDFARIVNDKRFGVLKNYLDQGTVVFGGQHDAAERYIAPTLMTNVGLDSALMKEEIFGPILPVIPWKDLDEVLKIVRRNPFPLSTYVFTKDRDTERFFTERIAFGGGCVNHCMVHFANEELPFGGIGHSGMGRYHGRQSYELFSHRKSMVRSSTFLDPGVQYAPYSAFKRKVLKWATG